MRYIAIACACVVLAGCAPDIYDRPNTTAQEFEMDKGACQMAALSIPQAQAPYIPPTYTSNTMAGATYSGGYMTGSAQTTTTPDYTGQSMANLGTAIGNGLRERNMMRACMASRGYTLRH